MKKTFKTKKTRSQKKCFNYKVHGVSPEAGRVYGGKDL